MKGPEAKKARPLAERLADLETRIQHLEREAKSVTPGEHTVSGMINGLRTRSDHLRDRMRSVEENPEMHHAVRGTGATSASRKDLSDRDQDSGDVAGSASPDTDLEALYRQLEDDYERARTSTKG